MTLPRFGGALTALGAVVATLLVAALLLWVGGYDVSEAAGAMWLGAFGSWSVFLSITLVRAVPLLLCGLAVGLAFRAGVWNIGAEGQLYAGAIAATWLGLTFASLPGFLLVPVVLIGAAVAGGLWALAPTVMKLRLGVGEVITTILLNFVAIHTASLMVHGPLQESRGIFLQSDVLPEAARIPSLVPGTRLHLGFGLAVLLAIGLAALDRRTAFGFRLRAVGASPSAASVSGRIRTGRVIAVAFLASGALAGLAGGIEIGGVTFALHERLSPGWGYTAIAVALLAGLHPLGIIATALLFGALQAGAASMQRDAGIPAAWASVVEALVILAVLALDRARSARAGYESRESTS